jgi:hypothetical protein
MKSNEALIRLYVVRKKFFFLNRNVMMLMIKMVIVTMHNKPKWAVP